ncbi:MAG: nuclear transport factor 2 family protein [Jatrophihabitans sp.]|uniref:nuclear transport factor 2 family protein n=1 Tax=Jatrophihabitans sp. TaxID=1932789 RepID=UPI00391031D4
MPLDAVRSGVLEHVAAFNAHDTERVLAGFTSDAVWITGTDRFEGIAALADVFDAWLWTLDPRLEVLSLVTEDQRAAAQLHESLVVDGQRRDFDIAVFFELDGGQIRLGKVYREGSAEL